MTTKQCKQCGELKPYDAAGGLNKKLSGFHGKVCWDCLAANRATPEGRAKTYAATAKYRATPEGRAKTNRASAKARSTAEGQAQCNERVRQAYAKAYATPEGRARYHAYSAKARSTEEGRTKLNAAAATWKKKYPEKVNALSMKRHTSKLKRIPSWADLDTITKIYAEAQKQGLEVDHIYPLQGALVSGLHVANNLQLLTKSENASKGNRIPKEA